MESVVVTVTCWYSWARLDRLGLKPCERFVRIGVRGLDATYHRAAAHCVLGVLQLAVGEIGQPVRVLQDSVRGVVRLRLPNTADE